MYNRYLQQSGAAEQEYSLEVAGGAAPGGFVPAEVSGGARAVRPGGAEASLVNLLRGLLKRLRLTELALDDILLLAIVFLVLRQSEDDDLLLILAALFFVGFFDKH